MQNYNIMRFKLFILLAAAVSLLSACGANDEGYKIVDGTIVFDVPERAEGQKSVLGLRTEPMEKMVQTSQLKTFSKPV